MTRPIIDIEKCIGCGQCITTCCNGVFENDQNDRIIVANPETCDGCGECVEDCLQEAITVMLH